MSKKRVVTKATSPEYVVLGLLDIRPSHGYELHQRLSSELRYIWNISLSQVYNILNRLQEQGYVHSEPEPQEDLPDRQRYRLTESGVQRLEAWLRSPVGPSVRAIRMAFTTKLLLAHARGDPPPEDLISEQEAAIERGLRNLTRSYEELPQAQLFSRLSLRLRITQLEALFDWLETCREIHFVEAEKPA
jgi:DNA-binding PadR family transcriptional regulator